jgi:translocation and assembly module TamB
MSEPTTATVTPPRHRWLRWLGAALLALLLLTGLLLGWLLGSGSGLRFALARASGITHGALTVQNAQGRLVGPLDLRGVRYRDGQGIDVKLASAHLDVRFWPLLRKRLHVLDLQADGIEVSLPPSQPDTAESASGFNLKPPIELLLDRVHIGTVTIRQGGQPLFASTRLDLAGAWTAKGITLRQLQLVAPDGHAELDGQLAVGGDYRGHGTAGFAWKIGDTGYAGDLKANSDGQRAQLDFNLARPAVAHLQLNLQQGGNYAWTGRLDAPRFDPQPLIGESSLHAVAVSLQGRGDRHGGSVDGNLGLNDYTLALQPLRARLSDDLKTLTLEQLGLSSPQIKGSVKASGVVQLGAQPVSGNLDIAWQDLQLPAELTGQALASQGSLKASGSAEKFHAEGDVDVGPPGKLARLALNLDGTPQQIVLHALDLKQPQGGLQAKGTLTLQPALAWQLDARADKLDPGQLLAGWDGALNFDIATAGQLPKAGPDATLEIRRLDGTLRQRAVKGAGKLHLDADQVIDGKLELASGGSTIHLLARPGSRNDIDLKLAIASLGDWLPAAGGRLDGQFNIKGKQPKLSVNGSLNGRALSYQQQRADTLRLIAGIPDIGHPAGKLELHSGGVNLSGLAFQHVDLLAEGSQADHKLTLDVRGTQLSAGLALHGALKGAAWNGTLSTLDLQPQGLPSWHLQKSVQLGYNDGAMSLSELCLSAGEPLLCASAKQDKGGTLDASYRLRALPLALLMNAAGLNSMPVRTDGELQGDGSIRRSAAGALSGHASISSAQGSVTYTDHPEAPLLSYRNLALSAQLSPASQRIHLAIGLDNGGSVNGQLGIGGAQQALDGQVSMHLGNLAFIELFTAEVASVKGSLNGDFRLGGTLAQPAVTGQAAIDGFAAEVPSAGLKLDKGRLTLRTADAKQFQIDGSVQSGAGSMAIDGSAGLGATASTAITLKASQFTAADIPAAKVVVSSNLLIKQSEQGLNVGGEVTLDNANVNLDKLPGAGTTAASPDVVVMDEKQQEAAQSQLPITAAVTMKLGHQTHLIGMGLDGRLGGQLVVSERPGRSTTGQGQIDVSGNYKAYGQNLAIERGQLLFASTPIDNPGLNIRAVRKINPNATIDEGQKVGLYISGTAQRPVLTVFSDPVMEQSDALSYLITGKPLSEVKGGEGSMVSSAAQALGSAGGDLLAKSIGSKIGVDDIGVSSNEALGGSSAFTVGKYLSPRLYLSYGVGLFEPGEVVTLRYLISHRWNFEAQSATEFSRASFNYRFER